MSTIEVLEANSARIRESDFEGWVVHLNDGSVIFEEQPDEAKTDLAPLVVGESQSRFAGVESRNTMDWKYVPHDQLAHVELYWHRDIWKQDQQPVVRISRPPDEHEIRFIQYKARGLQFQGVPENARRTPIMWYRLGFWDKVADVTRLVEVGLKEAGPNKITGVITPMDGAHPCWPKPLGFGMNPVILGITEADVPPVPANIPYT